MAKIDVYQDLKRKIITEQLEPGQWLVERDLCETYGISRTPIREVLFRLEADGFLVQEPSKGFFVRKLTLEQIFEIFQTREAVEGMAARLASQRAGKADLERFRELRVLLESVNLEQNGIEGVRLGRVLHDLIRETAGNALLADIYQRLNNLAELTANITNKSLSIELESRRYHLRIIDAIEKRNGDLAEQSMREHLRITCKMLVEVFYPGMLSNGSGAGNRNSRSA